MKNDNTVHQDPKIQELLEQFTKSRGELSKYMTDVDSIREKVGQILPQNSDFRNKWVLEEKIKTVSSFYATLLNIRQEFNKTLKEEIELRRKISIGSENEDQFDLRELAKMVETQQQEEEQKRLEAEEMIKTPTELKVLSEKSG